MVGRYVSTVQNSNKIEQIVKLSSDFKVMGSLVTPTIKQPQPLTLDNLSSQTMRMFFFYFFITLLSSTSSFIPHADIMFRSIIPPHGANQQNALPVFSLGIP